MCRGKMLARPISAGRATGQTLRNHSKAARNVSPSNFSSHSARRPPIPKTQWLMSAQNLLVLTNVSQNHPGLGPTRPNFSCRHRPLGSHWLHFGRIRSSLAAGVRKSGSNMLPGVVLERSPREFAVSVRRPFRRRLIWRACSEESSARPAVRRAPAKTPRPSRGEGRDRGSSSAERPAFGLTARRAL